MIWKIKLNKPISYLDRRSPRRTDSQGAEAIQRTAGSLQRPATSLQRTAGSLQKPARSLTRQADSLQLPQEADIEATSGTTDEAGNIQRSSNRKRERLVREAAKKILY